MTIKLNGHQAQKIQELLCSAFPTPSSLDQFVRFTLDVNIATIAADSSLEAMTFELVRWSEAHGRLDELLRGAVEMRPSRQDVRAVVSEVLGPQFVKLSSSLEGISGFAKTIRAGGLDRTTLQDIVNELIVQRRVLWEHMDAEVPARVVDSLGELAELCDRYRRIFNDTHDENTVALGDVMSAWMNESRLAVKLLRSRSWPAGKREDMEFLAYTLATFRERALTRAETFVALLPAGALRDQATDKISMGRETVKSVARVFRLEDSRLRSFVNDPQELMEPGRVPQVIEKQVDQPTLTKKWWEFWK